MYLHDDLKTHSSEPLTFEKLMKLSGECFRSLEGRATYRIFLGNHAYFIKQHRGVGWKEVFKNLFQGRLPILGAKNEWKALKRLSHLNINVPQVFAFGERGFNPAYKQSFVLMEAITNAISLEELCRDWSKLPPNVKQKRRLITTIADIASKMHNNGINHRDFYLCHFLLDQDSWKNDANSLKIYLIDLHRAQIRRLTPRRWIIKDLAGLYFSSRDIGLTKRDCYRFMKQYSGRTLRDLVVMDKQFWTKVKNRGEHLYRHHNPSR